MMDDYYKFDEVKIDEIKKAVPWMKDPRYFKRVKISPSAIVKMMTHAQSGVDKGTRRGGKPIEVMGLLLGRPDVSDPQCLIIADAQSLPCEGFETSVVANDESVTNYMIDLGEINEETRNEHFCGWYHTHPFDLDVNSHCYLSNTDISTQIQWQRAEDPYGNPYLAIVIDPLRSIAKGRPELMAFRTYPPEYTHTNLNELPDGTVEYNDKVRIAKYGVCWNRYYALEISYYMSDLSASTLNILKNNFLWMNTFTDASCLTNTDILENEINKINNTATKLGQIDAQLQFSGVSKGVSGIGGSRDVSTHDDKHSKSELNLCKTAEEMSDIAIDHCQGCMLHMTKILLFIEQSRKKNNKE